MIQRTTLAPPASRLIAGVLLLAVVTSACSAPPPSTAIGCGPASALVAYPATPELTGAPIGPLLIRAAYAPGSKDATALGFIVLVARNMDADIALSGQRCSDGQPLRFWLNKGGPIWNLGPGSTPVPDEVMASTGDLRALLPRIDAVATSGSDGYNGYVHFPTAGAYRIQGFAGDAERHPVHERPFPTAGRGHGTLLSTSSLSRNRPSDSSVRKAPNE